MAGHFTAGFFSFLRELKADNTREFFTDNRARYEADVRAPMLAFIDDLRPRLARVNRAFVADPRPTGGSMFRIHRDTRFSADKSPYKTHVAARFAHRAQPKGEMGPVFYLHLEPGGSFAGGGIYHPDSRALARIRHAIVDAAVEWRRIGKLGLKIEGASLTRVPAGFAATHPLATDLKRKDFYALHAFSQAEVCAADFVDRYAEACRRVNPLVAFLARSLGLKA